MVVKNIIKDIFPSMWPMILFVTVVYITLRCFYLFKGSKSIVLHKEILMLIFVVYVLCLYYILTYQDVGYGGINFVPFKEMFRYSFGSYKFIKNIIGNILLFIPFGFFVSYYLNNKKTLVALLSAFIVSGCAESLQYYIGRVFDIDDIILNVFGAFLGYLLFVCLSAIKGRLPKFMRTDAFINFLVIVIIIVIILFSLKINIFNYL